MYLLFIICLVFLHGVHGQPTPSPQWKKLACRIASPEAPHNCETHPQQYLNQTKPQLKRRLSQSQTSHVLDPDIDKSLDIQKFCRISLREKAQPWIQQSCLKGGWIPQAETVQTETYTPKEEHK